MVEPLDQIGDDVVTIQADPMSGMKGRRAAHQDRPRDQRLQMTFGGEQFFPLG